MIDFDLSIISILITIWIILIALLKLKYKKDLIYMVFFTIFFIYICNVIKYTQFSIMVDEFMREQIGQNIFKEANWILLIKLTKEDIKSSMLNIILTTPFGFGLPFLKKSSAKSFLGWGLLLSLSIELAQLSTALLAGYSMRYLDINDVIFNVSGVMIGFLSYRIFRKLLKKLIQNLSIESNEVLNFLTK